MELTTTQVSLFAALIALAAPAITYRASARLDRDRWVRERRAETWERYRSAMAAAAAAGSAEDAAVHRKEAEGHRAEVRTLYADLISLVREELKQDGDPWWRRIGSRSGSRTRSRTG